MSENTAYGTDWVPQFGAMCPKCQRYTKESYKNNGWRDASKTRYHQCPSCGYLFKSIQRQQDVPEPEPWQLENLRDYNGRRGGVLVGTGEWLGLPI